MAWQVRIGIAGVIALLGLWVLVNPVAVTGLATSLIPWALIGVGALYLVATLLRRRFRFFSLLLPGVMGVLMIYAGASMKFGNAGSLGPIPLSALFALLLFGSGTAKAIMAAGFRQSRYWLVFAAATAFSLVMGVLILFAWAEISAGWAGVVLGMEILGFAAFLAALALRDRDQEEAREALGADPRAEGRGKPWF